MAAVTIDDIINSLEFGASSYFFIFISGVLYTGGASQINLISLISPQLRCIWSLSSLQTSLISSSIFAGGGLGCLYWGFFGDKHGRKSVMVVGGLTTAYFGLLSSVSPNFLLFIVLRFFIGVGSSSAEFAMPYIAEFITMKHRGKAVIMTNFFYAFGSIYVATIALLMQTASWRIFLTVATIPGIVFLLLSPWLPESLRYLQNTGKYSEMVKILNRISVRNNTHNSLIRNIRSTPTSQRGNIKILFTKEYRWKMLILAVLFLSSHYGYYGVVMINTEVLQSGGFCNRNITVKSFQCHELSTKDYLQNIFVVTAELPGILIPALTVDVIGRKGYMIPSFVICGIGWLCMNICLSSRNEAVLMFLLRMMFAGLSQSPHVYAAELFPTVVRTSAVGILISICKFSLIGVPFLVQTFLHISFMATTMIFAGLCFLGALLVTFLPETKNSKLINM